VANPHSPALMTVGLLIQSMPVDRQTRIRSRLRERRLVVTASERSLFSDDDAGRVPRDDACEAGAAAVRRPRPETPIVKEDGMATLTVWKFPHRRRR
jgi:hypothetical protein